MAETNGKSKWIMYLTGVLVSLILFVALPSIVSAIVTNDRMSRDRDEKIRERVEIVHSNLKECITGNQIEIMRILTRLENKIDN